MNCRAKADTLVSDRTETHIRQQSQARTSRVHEADIYDREFHLPRVFTLHIVLERNDVTRNVRSAKPQIA